MFYLNIKLSKKTIIASTLICSLLLVGLFGNFLSSPASMVSMSKGSYSGKTNEERLQFLRSFGWEAVNEPTEIVEVIIPVEFDETYETYNSIQKKQGLDLSKYCGRRCKRYTYDITNYPDKETGVRANVLVFSDKIIGGDVCSLELGGFMHGFLKE